MFKKITILASFVSFVYGASYELPSIEEQYKNILNLSKIKKHDAEFKELNGLLEQNCTAIQENLTGQNLENFRKLQSLIQNTPLTLDLLERFYDYSADILELEQTGKTNSFSYDFSKSPTDEDESMIRLGIYRYTIVSEDGLIPIEIINDSIAHGIRLFGLPLKKSCFDGFDGPSRTFRNHDKSHSNTKHVKDSSQFDKNIKNYGHYLELINKYSEREIRDLDHLCLFALEHEHAIFTENFFSPREVFLNKVVSEKDSFIRRTFMDSMVERVQEGAGFFELVKIFAKTHPILYDIRLALQDFCYRLCYYERLCAEEKKHERKNEKKSKKGKSKLSTKIANFLKK